MTMAVTASFSSPTLTVTGDALDNAVTVSRDLAGTILINGGAVAISGTTPTVANTTLIQISGLDGNDALTLSETNGALPASNQFGGAGNDTLTGGPGNDQLFGEAGSDRIIWNPGDGNDTVEGGANFDNLDFFGANIAENIDIAANGGRVRFFRDVGAVTMDLNDVESIDFHALGGADSITVHDLSGTDVTTVTIDLEGSSSDTGDGQTDNVFVEGTGAGDTIQVSD